MGINTIVRNDPWVIKQFYGFDGTPDSIGVNGNGATVLIPGVSPTIQQNPLMLADSTPTLYAVNPTGSGDEVFGVGGQEKAMSDMNVNGGGEGTGGEIGPAVLPQLQVMPSATAATMPTVTGTANAVLGTNGQVGNGPIAITPAWLNQRLPSIVNPAPLDMGVPGCGGGVGGWVGENPVMALVGLAALAYAVWGRGK